MTTHLLGCDPSPPDPRDYRLATATLAALGDVARFTNGSELRLPRGFGRRFQTGPACVGNTGAQTIETILAVKGRTVPRRSGNGAYYVSRHFHQATRLDRGSYMRALGQGLLGLGCPSRELHPEDKERVDLTDAREAQPSDDALVEAHDTRALISAYYRTSDDHRDRPDEIEATLRQLHPVPVALNCADSFMQHRGDRVLGPDDVVYHTRGHAVLICGVRGAGEDREFLIDNWWPGFGDAEGMAWLNIDAVRALREGWAFTVED